MNRRKAIAGIIGFTGIGFVSVTGAKYFIGNSAHSKGMLRAHESLIAELVDVIIPPTSSPGAKSANVQGYIIGYLENCSSEKEFNNFVNGLDDLQENALNSFKSRFEQCSQNQKVQLLEKLDNHWNSKGILSKISSKIFGRSFFKTLKILTIEGYCTSRIGATQFLKYDPIPGKYKAITQLEEHQIAWATR